MSKLSEKVIETVDLLNEINTYFDLVEIAIEQLRQAEPSKTADRLHLLLDLFVTCYRQNFHTCHDNLMDALQVIREGAGHAQR